MQQSGSWYEGWRSLAVAVVVVAGAGALFWYAVALREHGAERAAATESAAPSTLVPEAAAAAVAAPEVAPVVTARVDLPAAAPASARAAEADEATLMSQLRALVHTAPEQALALARRGDALFPNSPDAPERAWSVVKSLDLLKRFHEAQAEARLMLRLYPDTPWTEDVERHVLLYPLDMPSREEQQAAAGRTE
ncbi:MAG TPA: hypothetical protein VHP33_24980 [Polyangiaceae bacterium]|nr:hypothetical protein [Polyangiaceae bacterium]